MNNELCAAWAASVGVDAVSGSSGLIWPGDHVDLILTQTLDDPLLPASHRIAAETVLSDVRVIAIDQLLARGVAPASETAGTARTVTPATSRLSDSNAAEPLRDHRRALVQRLWGISEPVGDTRSPPTIWSSVLTNRPRSSSRL